MTAKEKVLSVYPDAFKHEVINGIAILSVQKANETDKPVLGFSEQFSEDDAWQNALNELQKQQLCTE
jgi:hypothetical protein